MNPKTVEEIAKEAAEKIAKNVLPWEGYPKHFIDAQVDGFSEIILHAIQSAGESRDAEHQTALASQRRRLGSEYDDLDAKHKTTIQTVQELQQENEQLKEGFRLAANGLAKFGVSTWDIKRGELMEAANLKQQLTSLQRENAEKEKDVQFYRNSFNRASEELSTLRAENERLEKSLYVAQEACNEVAAYGNCSCDGGEGDCAVCLCQHASKGFIADLGVPNVSRIINLIESICGECGHTKTEDGCAYCIKQSTEAIRAENERLNRDREEAAGELMVDLREMPVGSTLSKVVSANKIIRDERNDLRTELEKVRGAVKEADPSGTGDCLHCKAEGSVADFRCRKCGYLGTPSKPQSSLTNKGNK